MRKQRRRNGNPSAKEIQAAQFEAAGLVDGYAVLDQKIKGLVEEKDRYADKLRLALETLGLLGVVPKADGTAWTATLVPTRQTIVNIKRFQAVCPPRLFLACIMVRVEQAKKLAGAEVVKQASRTVAGTPRLLVERKEVKGG